VQLIAYSEHSQCNELMEFVGFLRPKQVVPTVFSDDKQRVAMLDMFAPLLDRMMKLSGGSIAALQIRQKVIKALYKWKMMMSLVSAHAVIAAFFHSMQALHLIDDQACLCLNRS